MELHEAILQGDGKGVWPTETDLRVIRSEKLTNVQQYLYLFENREKIGTKDWKPLGAEGDGRQTWTDEYGRPSLYLSQDESDVGAWRSSFQNLPNYGGAWEYGYIDKSEGKNLWKMEKNAPFGLKGTNICTAWSEKYFLMRTKIMCISTTQEAPWWTQSKHQAQAKDTTHKLKLVHTATLNELSVIKYAGPVSNQLQDAKSL